jgi:hypothetical protein
MKKYIYKSALFLSFVILCILIFLQGCKKDEERKITGSWLKVIMSSQELFDKDTTIWTFKNGNTMCRFQSYLQSGHRMRYFDTTSYEIKRDFPYWNIKFSKLGEWSMSIAKNYTIEKVDNKILILNPVEAYPRIEFTKLN